MATILVDNVAVDNAIVTATPNSVLDVIMKKTPLFYDNVLKNSGSDIWRLLNDSELGTSARITVFVPAIFLYRINDRLVARGYARSSIYSDGALTRYDLSASPKIVLKTLDRTNSLIITDGGRKVNGANVMEIVDATNGTVFVMDRPIW